MGTDAWGNPVAWDLGTQDGRWLAWRDNKIRQGTWSGVTRPDLAALHEACPHDARRPKGEPSNAVNDVFPPFPLDKNEGETSCTQSFNAERGLEKLKRRNKRRKPRQRNAANASASKEEPPDDHSTSVKLGGLGSSPDETVSPERPASNNRDRILSGIFGPDPAKLVPPKALASDPAPSILVPTSPVPPNAAPAGLEPTKTGTTHFAKVVRSDRIVQAPIKYNRWTAGGCWLQRRDARVRSGKFNVAELDEWELALHLEFPYTPEMLLSKIAECNHRLREHWKSRPLRDSTEELANKELEITQTDSGLSQIRNAILAVVTELKDLPRKPKDHSPSLSSLTTCPHQLKKLSLPGRGESIIPETTKRAEENTKEDMPNSAFIRSRRLAFFAQRQQAEAPEAHESERDERNIKALMKDAGIDVDRPQLTKKDSAMGIWAASDSEKESHAKNVEKPVPQHSATATENHRGSSSHSSHEQGFDVVDRDDLSKTAGAEDGTASQAHVKGSEKVPSTRYPNTPVEERPRDEDPRIMPIPRTYGFKFDVRQLRDLAVIKEGGNGCARDGQEFEIEQDYEWGGGGEMGYKSTSGVRQSSAPNEEVYEYGKGDEGGLLNELPGIDD